MLLLSLCVADVGGYFETGTLVRYDFLPDMGAPVPDEMKGSPGWGLSGEVNLTREELVFSFSTHSAPSILVYISSRTQDSLAVVLRQNGGLMSMRLLFIRKAEGTNVGVFLGL